MKKAYADEEQLIAKAVEALIDRLGAVEAVRFLTLPHETRLESVERHRQWQEGLDAEDFFARVFS